MKTYDCFTFYNEFDLLEIRLEELWNVVDFFVIAEADITFQNQPKSFLLKDNWERFRPYQEKIRHIMINDMPRSNNPWDNEFFQRNSLSRGLYDVSPEDIVVISDSDEIPRSSALTYIKLDKNPSDRYCLCMPIFYFKLNYMMTEPVYRQINIKAVRGNVLQNPHWERSSFNYIPGVKELEHAGWHWTYLGDTQFAINKLKSFSHAESNRPDIIDYVNIDQMIEQKLGLTWMNSSERFQYVHLDDYFPRTITEQKGRYSHLILQNTEYSVRDFYR